MKQNNKGITLIESIITIAIISIVLLAMSVAFTNIIHYMGESSLIKSTSNDIFKLIQDDESQDNRIQSPVPATMTFRDGLTVDVEMVTVTDNYNDKDSLSLSKVKNNPISIPDNPTISSIVSFYLIKNPEYINHEYNDSNSIYVDQKEKALLSIAVDTSNPADVVKYLDTTKIPTSNSTNSVIQLLLNADSTGIYTSKNIEDYDIVWYKIKNAKKPSPKVYGFLKPKNSILCRFEFGNITNVFVNVDTGLTKEQYLKMKPDWISEHDWQDDMNWYCDLDNCEYEYKYAENGKQEFDDLYNDEEDHVNEDKRFKDIIKEYNSNIIVTFKGEFD